MSASSILFWLGGLLVGLGMGLYLGAYLQKHAKEVGQ